LVRQRLPHHGYSGIDDEQINYALSSNFADGDVDKAVELLVLLHEAVEGIIKPYDLSVLMLGAINRGNVTCYLDALLFAMFARMDNFEPILCTNFEDEDEPKRRLSTLIRLWVNMLRTGKLIPTDIVGFHHMSMLHKLIRNTDTAFAGSPCCMRLAGSCKT
jgi:hypothetical protein